MGGRDPIDTDASIFPPDSITCTLPTHLVDGDAGLVVVHAAEHEVNAAAAIGAAYALLRMRATRGGTVFGSS